MKKFLQYVLLYGLVEAVRGFVINKIWAKRELKRQQRKNKE